MSALSIVLSCIGVGFCVCVIILLIKAYFPVIVKVVGIGILLAVIAVACYFLSTITVPIW